MIMESGESPEHLTVAVCALVLLSRREPVTGERIPGKAESRVEAPPECTSQNTDGTQRKRRTLFPAFQASCKQTGMAILSPCPFYFGR